MKVVRGNARRVNSRAHVPEKRVVAVGTPATTCYLPDVSVSQIPRCPTHGTVLNPQGECTLCARRSELPASSGPPIWLKTLGAATVIVALIGVVSLVYSYFFRESPDAATGGIGPEVPGEQLERLAHPPARRAEMAGKTADPQAGPCSPAEKPRLGAAPSARPLPASTSQQPHCQQAAKWGWGPALLSLLGLGAPLAGEWPERGPS